MISKLIEKAKTLFYRMFARFDGLHVFAANEDGDAEYVVAHSKREAYDLLREQWGDRCMDEYINDFREMQTCESEDAFIECFIRQFPDNKNFTIYDEDENIKTTKTAKQWADDEGCVCWLCGEP